MNRKRLSSILIAAGLVVSGLALIGLSLVQPVTFQIDGQTFTRRVQAVTVGDALRSAQVPLDPGDRLSPPVSAWLWADLAIRIDRAALIGVEDGSEIHSVLTTEKIAANVIELAGLRLYPGDQIFQAGSSIPAKAVLTGGRLLQVKRAVPLTVIDRGQSETFLTSASTLGQAVWQNGLRLGALDQLSPGLETPLSLPLTVTVSHPASLQVTVGGQLRAISTNAATVGQALSEAGIRLVGLDYAEPPQNASLPANGQIKVVRVREIVTLAQKTIPFETTTQADPKTELDQRSVIQPGQEGLLVTRLRVRFEDGKEVSRQTDAEWQARAPQKRILGYGTQIVLHTTTVDGVTIQYYRAITVYATSYSPCDSGTCNYKAASGATIAKGIIGVSPAWYNLFLGQRVFVPGYGSGVIADYGGISGHRIDLGYSDSDFVGWHKNVTLYFLAPAPATVPWTLP